MDFTFGNSAGKPVEELAQLFNTGFSDYFTSVNMTAETFGDYMRAFQVDPARSALAYSREGAFGGCSMLGLRGQRGWIGGFGVAPEFRGKGVAGQLMDWVVGYARQNQLNSLALEVLQPNERAYKLYLKKGFKVTRNLVLYDASDQTIREAAPTVKLVEERELEPGVGLAALGMPEQNRDFPPCWQRETPSILGQRGARARIGRLESGERGLLVYLPIPSRRRIALLHAGFEIATGEKARLTLLSGLLRGAVESFGPASVNAPPASFSIMNEPEGSGLTTLLKKLGFGETWRQYEMVLDLQAGA